MLEVLPTAVSVATPLALLGFVAALAYLGYTRRQKSEIERLRLLPPEQRATAINDRLTIYGIDGGTLPPADKLGLIKDETEKRYRAVQQEIVQAKRRFGLSEDAPVFCC
jgi:hypothetical protein